MEESNREISDIPLLRYTSDYPAWKLAVKSKLAGENVSECILERDQPIKNSLKAELIEIGFTPAEAAKKVISKILIDAINKQKKDNTKALKILLKCIALSLFSTVNNKQPHNI